MHAWSSQTVTNWRLQTQIKKSLPTCEIIMCSRPRSPFGDTDPDTRRRGPFGDTNPDTQTPVMKFYHSMSSDTLGCLSKDGIIIDSKGRPCVSVFIFQPRVWHLYLHSMGQHPRITPHPGNRSLSATERDTLYQRVCVCV